MRPVWVDERDGNVLVNTGGGWRKDDNARRDPRVALSMVELENPYERIEIRGAVMERAKGEQAEAQLDVLAGRYLGLPRYPWRRPSERRAILVIAPESVVHHVDTDDPDTLPVA